MSNALEKTTKIDSNNIVAAECRHVVYIPPLEDNGDDYHFIKEVLHVKNGDTVVLIPNTRVIKNFERKFWISKEAHRNYKQKKEWDDLSKMREYTCTQGQLLRRASLALGNYQIPRSLRQLAQNPYLYGCDISSTAVIKQEKYRDRFPDTFTPSTVAASDTETSVRTGEVLMQTLSFKSNVYTAVTRSFLASVGGSDEYKKKLLQEALIKYLGQDEPVMEGGKHKLDKNGNPMYTNIVKDRNIKWEIDIVQDEGVVVWNTLQKAHKLKPDFLAFWNAPFDINTMNGALKRHDINLANAWCDPSIPEQYRYFKFVEGQPQKVTASGKITPIPMQARWHTVHAPASFYVVDSMCVYKQVRTGKPEEREYNLDYILEKHLKRGKLKFKEADGLSKADWHIFMQKNYPIEYVIYNVFDCIGMELLDEKTNDLAVSMPSGAAMSDYSKFNSQPRRVCDKLHYFVQKRGKVMGTTADKMATDLDKKTIGLNNWIVMLPAHLVVDNGLKLIAEYPELSSNIRVHFGDLDVSASYPNGEVTNNVSKETTSKELLSIAKVSENTRRIQGINVSGGATNSVEIATGLLKLPQMTTWLKAYQQQDAIDEVTDLLSEENHSDGSASIRLFEDDFQEVE